MLTEIDRQIRDLCLEDKQKSAILRLIEIKTDSDMEKVLNKLDFMEKSLKTEISSVKWLFGAAVAIFSVTMALIKFL